MNYSLVCAVIILCYFSNIQFQPLLGAHQKYSLPLSPSNKLASHHSHLQQPAIPNSSGSQAMGTKKILLRRPDDVPLAILYRSGSGESCTKRLSNVKGLTIDVSGIHSFVCEQNFNLLSMYKQSNACFNSDDGSFSSIRAGNSRCNEQRLF